jgi:hypothetical protein
MDNRKMAFYEINKQPDGEGSFYYPLAVNFQKSFEKIQQECFENKGAASVTLKITVLPPEKESSFGNIIYQISESLPPKKSAKYFSELDEQGRIITTGKDTLTIDQLNLEFPKQTILHKINGE